MLDELFSQAQWERLMNAYSEATCGNVSVCNNKGKQIAKYENKKSFCCTCDGGGQDVLCERCRAMGGYEAFRRNKPYIYRCNRNAFCVAVPIVAGGNYIGATIAEGISVKSNGEVIDIITEPSVDSAKDEKHDYGIDYEMIVKISELMQAFCCFITDSGKNPTAMKKTDATASASPVRKEQSQSNSDSVSLLFPAFDYIATHFVERISVQYLADLCHVSVSYFSRLFCKETRDRLPQYIMKLRISYAKQQLSTTEKSVAVIAVDSGFSDSSHFIKAFKSAVGVTPLQYRKTVMEGDKQ